MRLRLAGLVCAIGMGWAPAKMMAFAPQASSDAKVQEIYAKAQEAQRSGNITEAVRQYEEILKIAPRLGPAYNNLGSLYFRQRDFAQAAAVLRKGLQVNPGMPSAVALLGISLYEMGDYGEARAKLEAAVKANPEDPDLQLYLAKDLSRAGALEAAEKQLVGLSGKQPQNQEIWYLLAKLHMRLSERDLAQMKAINPDSALSHQLSGEVMESMNNYEGAVVELKKAVELAPRQAGGHYRLGDAYLTLSQWGAATEQFQAELAIDPESCPAHWKLGRVLVESDGDAQEALHNVDQALARCPGLTEALPDRGRALVKLNRPADAAADLEKAAKAMPDDPAIHFLLGKIYRTLGRTRESQAEMQIYSQLDEKQRSAVAEQAQEVIKNKESAH